MGGANGGRSKPMALIRDTLMANQATVGMRSNIGILGITLTVDPDYSGTVTTGSSAMAEGTGIVMNTLNHTGSRNHMTSNAV